VAILNPLQDASPEPSSPERTATAALPGQPVGASAGAQLLGRLVWLFFFAAPAIVFGIALTLSPNPVGHGTHTQLGLPPCGFLLVTGLPCPGCGLTTCFTYMVHGDVVGAASANPFGVMLWLVSAATMVLGAVGFVRGLPVIDTLDRLQADKWAILLSVSSLTVWGVRVLTLLLGL
jgi:hypothetical protein